MWSTAGLRGPRPGRSEAPGGSSGRAPDGLQVLRIGRAGVPPPSRRPHTCSCPRASAARGCSPSRAGPRWALCPKPPRPHHRGGKLEPVWTCSHGGLFRTSGARSSSHSQSSRRSPCSTSWWAIRPCWSSCSSPGRCSRPPARAPTHGDRRALRPRPVAAARAGRRRLRIARAPRGDCRGGHRRRARGGPRPASRAPRGPARPRTERAPRGHPRARRARGHPQRGRRRRDRPGARRQPDLCERRGARDRSASSRARS